MNNMKTFIQVIAINSQLNKIKTPRYMSDCLQFIKSFLFHVIHPQAMSYSVC